MSDGNAGKKYKAKIESKDKLLDKAGRFVYCNNSSETCHHAGMPQIECLSDLT
jgi:hypothetical protein